MAVSLLELVRAALADRYMIDRELGRGGMAHVFLAQDLKHHRPVAIKVLRPELAAALGPDRFLREIAIAARLTHPHILPLHDSGEVGGLLYYVMPYVEGESLRDRLMRKRRLPVVEAVDIARQVASALTYAHSHDVVHRDIKPENILLAGDEVVVADFGIARAITAAQGDQLTSTGIVVGTPAYMSPEQAAGEIHLDGRSDVYALGCVLYETLAGAPPWALLATPIQARHIAAPVPPLRSERESVPVHVEQAIMKALAKVPANRFATASQFADALIQPPRPPSPDREWGIWGQVRRRRTIVSATAVLALGLAVWATIHWLRPTSESLNPNLVAVLPFRVTGADSLYGEGMVDLLAAKLTGEGGPRAANPQFVINAWRRTARAEGKDLSQQSAVRLARGLGAGRLLLGAVVETPNRLSIHATLLAVTSGSVQAEADVEGPPDSLSQLVDRLASRILAFGAGVTAPGLASLTSTSVPALRAYLEGQVAYRQARWDDARRELGRALELDSTFARAALALIEAAPWGVPADPERAIRLAWASRDRLSVPDQAMLAAQTGPLYPLPSSQAEILAARNELVGIAPDDPLAWFLLGDQFFHWGTLLAIDNSDERARAAFERALAIKPDFAEPLGHLVTLAARRGDTVEMRRVGAIALAGNVAGEGAGHLRWLLAFTLRDSIALASARAGMDRMTKATLLAIVRYSVWGLESPDDGKRALAALDRMASTDIDRLGVLRTHHLVALNAGRPQEGRAAAESLKVREVGPDVLGEARLVLDGLYWDGDSGAAAAAARSLARNADGPLDPRPAARRAQYRDICVLEQWRLAHGATATAARAIGRLRGAAAPADSFLTVAYSHECAALLDALLAAIQRQPRARQSLDRLDSLMKTGPPGWDQFYGSLHAANLVVARLREARGDMADALAAVRRRGSPYIMPTLPLFLPSYLRQEGRLAALTGDTAGAIRAYSQYLRLRYDPEPALKPEVERIRTELARLMGEKH